MGKRKYQKVDNINTISADKQKKAVEYAREGLNDVAIAFLLRVESVNNFRKILDYDSAFRSRFSEARAMHARDMRISINEMIEDRRRDAGKLATEAFNRIEGILDNQAGQNPIQLFLESANNDEFDDDDEDLDD